MLDIRVIVIVIGVYFCNDVKAEFTQNILTKQRCFAIVHSIPPWQEQGAFILYVTFSQSRNSGCFGVYL
eukprot:4064044-Ditylum_brightwellii.AAC.1